MSPPTNGPGDGATDPPRLSVCITTRGRAALLNSCLGTLAAQVDAPTFELLVCCQADASAAPVVRMSIIENPKHAHSARVQRAQQRIVTGEPKPAAPFSSPAQQPSGTASPT